MKKMIPIVLCIVVILACRLPWPTRYELSMHGAEITPEGAVIREGDILISGRRLNYLFRYDEMAFKKLQFPNIAFPEPLTNKRNITNGPIYEDLSDSYDTVFTIVYLPEENEFTSIQFFLSKQGDWCVIRVEFHGSDRYFAGSLQEDFDPATLLEICGISRG